MALAACVHPGRAHAPTALLLALVLLPLQGQGV